MTHTIHQNVLQVDENGNPVSASGGDASAANQATGNASLSSIDTKLTTLAGYVDTLETLIAATNAAIGSTNGFVDGIEGLLGTLNGYVDGIETLIGTTNTSLTTLQGYVDGLETLVGATNTALATLSTNLTTIDGHVDGLESVTGTTADAVDLAGGATTISAKLRGVVQLLVTQATYLDGIEGKLDTLHTDLGLIHGWTVNSTATITRPADTTAYAAKDAISSSTSAPAILTFANCARASGGSGYITSARVVTNQAACVSAFRLHLYDATLSAVNDNAAQTVLETNWGSSIGYIDFPAMATDGTDTASSQSVDKPLPFVAAGTSLFGMLETITGFTPASAQHFQVKLGIEQN